jgi:hypothetical protein|tara:strand:+ start:10469 stop:10978 length:510 start_codon:yes stop_codon:yes gene_type:complete
MTNNVAAFKGWSSSVTAWNDGAWNVDQAFTLTSTASVGQAVLEGDAIIAVTGVSGTASVNEVFTTNNGLSSTASIGTVTTTRGDNASVTGVGATAALGNVFTTNVGLAGTTSINDVTITGTAIVTVTGVSATASIGSLKTIWGEIIPSQTSNFSAISPSQSPSWTNIAA